MTAARQQASLTKSILRQGAEIIETMEEMYAKCDMVAKVKEFFPVEYPLIRENQIILGCIHPAGHPEEVDALLKSN